MQDAGFGVSFRFWHELVVSAITSTSEDTASGRMEARLIDTDWVQDAVMWRFLEFLFSKRVSSLLVRPKQRPSSWSFVCR